MTGKFVRFVLDAITRKDVITTIVPIFIYFISVGIYLHPITSAPTPSEPPNNTKQRWNLIYNPKPQLDELHIMSPENHDISPQPTTLWTEAWHNDYWGRPLTFESSHKSWRPVSVWSFRFAKGGEFGRRIIAMMGKAIGSFMEGVLTICGCGYTKGTESSYNKEGEHVLASELFVHRFFNVIIHASIVQLVGVVATLLFPSSSKDKNNNLQLYTRYLSQLLFALHPVHVEAVVNVANRPHILALLFNATISDPNVSIIAMAILASLGLLTAETALFQFPAIVLTMTAIRYGDELSIIEEGKGNERKEEDQKKASQQESESPLFKTFVDLLPRYMLLVIISVTYLLNRHYNNTLSIPDGLIRAAENPFYEKLDEWTLSRRVINYSYILSLHIMKSFGVDLVGFSHEYGYNCIPEIMSARDYRLILPISLIFLVGIALVCAWYGWKIPWRNNTSSKPEARENEKRVQRILLTLVFFSWMATLFPISGILKVGTFVADRIAVASSFGTCIFVGRFFAVWITDANNSSANTYDMTRLYRPLRYMVLFYVCVFALAKRTHTRAAEWMDSVPLFESSLKTCPRSIKSNLEMSKLYSGLIPHMLDLDKALSLISTAQSIDPEYCDVHQQYAHCYFQQSKYISFEEEMVQSLLCKFTMGQAMTNWQNYWKVVLSDKTNDKARARYERYMARIGDEIKRGQREEEEERRRVDRSSMIKEEL